MLGVWLPGHVQLLGRVWLLSYVERACLASSETAKCFSEVAELVSGSDQHLPQRLVSSGGGVWAALTDVSDVSCFRFALPGD